jgi:hypothetical protein
MRVRVSCALACAHVCCACACVWAGGGGVCGGWDITEGVRKVNQLLRVRGGRGLVVGATCEPFCMAGGSDRYCNIL